MTTGIPKVAKHYYSWNDKLLKIKKKGGSLFSQKSTQLIETKKKKKDKRAQGFHHDLAF